MELLISTDAEETWRPLKVIESEWPNYWGNLRFWKAVYRRKTLIKRIFSHAKAISRKSVP